MLCVSWHIQIKRERERDTYICLWIFFHFLLLKYRAFNPCVFSSSLLSQRLCCCIKVVCHPTHIALAIASTGFTLISWGPIEDEPQFRDLSRFVVGYTVNATISELKAKQKKNQNWFDIIPTKQSIRGMLGRLLGAKWMGKISAWCDINANMQ